ncbi:MAG: hypothetical protein J0L82_01360 [Deltaproteobacteria bacterium]|nr:hypothetical protein [Deltaproteobacteria bacterium]
MPKYISKRTAVLSGCLILGLLFAHPNLALGGSESKFERDLESLFGAALATKHGSMIIRQRKDDAGRVRKQIFVGPSFSEIQLDQNADGTVDFWEITRGEKTVLATNPSRGRFLRMNVTERSKEGTFEAFYVLDLDGRRYNLLRTKFDRADRRLMSESVPASFAAEEIPDAPSKSIAPGFIGGVEKSEVDRFPIDDFNWRYYQVNYFGNQLLCESDDMAKGRAASLQREWWKILKHDAKERVDLLTAKLKESKMFDSSCQKPGRENDFEKIVSSLAELMMTSSKGEPSADSESRGRYLKCLEQSGLGINAARIEQNFLSGLNNPRSDRLISCDFKPGTRGKAQPGYANHTTKQVVLHLCLPDEGIATTTDGSAQNYKNVLFHELVHISGIENEDLTHAAQACCGDPTNPIGRRKTACGKLDQLVVDNHRFLALESHFARDEQMATLLSELNVKFQEDGTAELFRGFLLGLDKAGIIDDSAFSNCLVTLRGETCRASWAERISKYATDFFRQDCQNIVVGSKRLMCGQVSESFRERLATSISNSLIELRTDGETVNPRSCQIEPNSSRLFGRAAPIFQFLRNYFSRANADYNVPCEDGMVVPPRRPITQVPPSNIPGEVRPIVWNTSIDLGMKSPSISVPGASDLDDVVSRSGSDQSVATAPSVTSLPVRDPDRSPLPVTRVTSLSSGRSMAETSYQRATDVAGLATRGFKYLREAIVPQAIAVADRSQSNSKRLTSEGSFIAFRPTRSDLKALRIDNLFAANRTAAVSVKTNGGTSFSLNSTRNVGDVGAASRFGDRGANAGISVVSSTAPKPPSAAGNLSAPQASATESSDKASSRSSMQAGAATVKPKAGRDPAQAVASPDLQEQPDLLVGLFTKRYRLVERRLMDLKVQQQLIDRSIKVIGSNGRIVGAKKRYKTCYEFAGQERPLKTPCED